MSWRAIRRGIAATALACGFSLAGASAASAAPPQIVSVAVAEGSVSATGVTLLGQVNPEGAPTTYRFEYLSEAAYEANLAAARDPFQGAALAPASGAGPLGSGTTSSPVSQHLSGLPPETAYRFRPRVIHSGEEAVYGPTRPFATAPATNAFALLDSRGWEMVSPVDKNGGSLQLPGEVSGGGVFQAAVAGGSATYSSAGSFGEGAQGAPAGSQYLATRGSSGWVTANITTPLLSGSYGSEPDGVPYQLFSGALSLALLSNGERCRGSAGGECPVANPPLPGSGAPPGYRDYYRRTSSGSFESLLSGAALSHTSLGPDELELHLVAATPDLAHVVLSSCAALSANATEVTAPGGCDPEAQNLYEWSGGALSLVNLLPNEATGTPGARIAAPNGAVSADGSRVYFSLEGKLYLREAGVTKLVSEAPGASFEAASADGSTAFVIAAGDLFRYAAGGTLAPLTSGGGVEGVLGISADGSKAYYAKSGALFLQSGASTSEVAASALPQNWPAATGTARVSADGSHLLFLSKAELTGYPNEGDTEAFLYGPPPGGGSPLLACVSCNPSGERPRGSASVPGARPNGNDEGAFEAYKPRALSADGERVFFQSGDSLVAQDTNNRTDVYEWEAAGEGSCVRAGGCVQLISGGRDSEPSYFLDADAGGSEAFFLTAASLYPRDPGSYDLYVAREGGGLSLPAEPVPCIADACQVLPEAPEDPTPGTLVPSSGNPALKIEGGAGKPKKGHKKPKKGHRGHGKKRIQDKGQGR